MRVWPGEAVVTSTERSPVEQSPVEVPLYTVWDVVRYLRLPVWAVLTLSGRFRDWPHPEPYVHFARRFAFPVLIDEELELSTPHELRDRLSFHEISSVFVRSFGIRCLSELARGASSIEEKCHLWESIWRGCEDTRRIAIFGENAADGREQLISTYVRNGADEGKSVWLRKWLDRHLDRVVVDGTSPVRLFPFSRDPAEASPRVIVIDPLIRFGRPTLDRSGTPTDILFERHQAGDSIAELAEDYGVTAAEVEEAIRYEAAPGISTYPYPDWCW